MMMFSSLNTTTPTEAILAANGLKQTEYKNIMDVSAGDFQGWGMDEIEGMNFLGMFWSGSSNINFNTMAGALNSLFNENVRDSNDGIQVVLGSGYILCYFI